MIKAADRLPWSTCEQGFVSRRKILYGILATSVVNKVVYTKKDELCYSNLKQSLTPNENEPLQNA